MYFKSERKSRFDSDENCFRYSLEIYTIIKRNTSSFYPPLQPVERKCKRVIILKLDVILCLYIYYFLHFTRPQAKVVT